MADRPFAFELNPAFSDMEFVVGVEVPEDFVDRYKKVAIEFRQVQEELKILRDKQNEARLEYERKRRHKEV